MTTSYWQHTTHLPSPTPETGAIEPIRAEVCIIGGGIVGASAAYLLQRAGIECVVLEAREPALGATGRNAGMLVAGIGHNYAQAVREYGRLRARELWQFTIRNREATIRLAEKLGVDVRRCGSWQLADTAEEAAELAEAAQLMREDELPVEFADHDPLGRGFTAALGNPNDATLHPAQLVQALLATSNTTVIAHSPVTHIEPSETGRMMSVTSARTTVTCKNVFVATNAYLPQLFPQFEERVFPVRGQIYVTAPAPMVLERGGSSHNGYYYFHQIPEPSQPGYGRWLIGGARQTNFESENGHYEEQTTADIQAALEAFTRRYFPELTAVPIEHRWAGTMGFTSNALPLIGQLEEMPRVTYCAGFTGHGMALALKSVETALMQMLDVV